jgi:hypothetical protein
VWVWDKSYINLFKSLKAECANFHIFNPFQEIVPLSENYESDMVYYLQDETEDELHRLYTYLMNLCVEKIKLRLHPLYTDIALVKKIFINFEIDDEEKITDSISKTKSVCSKYSTVLFIAYSNEKKIIVDDISNKLQFEMLKNQNYFFAEEKFTKLSDLLNK